MSKRRGLPQEARMRHDSHFVEALSSRFGASLGRWIPLEEIETNPEHPSHILTEQGVGYRLRAPDQLAD